MNKTRCVNILHSDTYAYSHACTHRPHSSAKVYNLSPVNSPHYYSALMKHDRSCLQPVMCQFEGVKSTQKSTQAYMCTDMNTETVSFSFSHFHFYSFAYPTPHSTMTTPCTCTEYKYILISGKELSSLDKGSTRLGYLTQQKGLRLNLIFPLLHTRCYHLM